MNILGISAYYHDSAAALLRDGELVAAAQEERFTRVKHDASFPRMAIQYCLDYSNVSWGDIDYVVFYDKPLLKFERLIETYLAYAPRGFRSFIASMPVWLKEKLYLKKMLKQELTKLALCKKRELPTLLFTEHHHSHAASAFYPSPYKQAAVLCLDGVGEWATASCWLGENNSLRPLWQINFPHSLGLLYSAFTYYLGFKVNSGEYKVMGLAPYGKPIFKDLIKKHLIDIKPDGTFRLNMKYFDYPTGLVMTNKRFADLFGGPARKPESDITQKEMDLARSIQEVTEEVVLRLANTICEETGQKNLCLSGGVALNCVANGRLLRESSIENIWVQPASGDAGGAVGAAYAVWHQYLNKPRTNEHDEMGGAYLGPMFDDEEIKTCLDSVGAQYEFLTEAVLLDRTADLLQQSKVVGWFQGRMEFGPRALGARSILGDPRDVSMQSVMNQKIKFRESFRPFAPAIKEDKLGDWFDLHVASPYMALVANVRDEHRTDLQQQVLEQQGLSRLGIKHSNIPAVTHVDCSARIQTVNRQTNRRFYDLLDRFEAKTGCPVLINTSFNVRGEPIVCTPEDAFRCFIHTEMDYLVIGNYILDKESQPAEMKEKIDKAMTTWD